LNVKSKILGWIAGAIASVVCVVAQSNATAGDVANALSTTPVSAAAAAPATTDAPAPAAPAATDAPAPAARTASKGGNEYLGLIIWGVVIAAVFGFLWSKGYLVKIRNYIEETQEELKKCSWPNREELKGSTVVVMVTITLLGLFTVGVDWLLASLMRLIT
jgi:preprotein translocase subunit SecE